MHNLFVMSVDSLFTSDLADVRHLPGFSRLLEQAAIFEDVGCVYPTLTYVCHATIMSGCWPERHGIPHNQVLEPATDNVRWYWDYDALKVDTVFDVAKRAGLTTAAVGWPVTAGADPIDVCVPEVWSVTGGADLDDIYATGCSDTGYEAYRMHRGLLRNNACPQLDEFDIACEEQIIDEHRPNVMLTHQAMLDHVRHVDGVHGPKVQDALAHHDSWIVRIMDALERQGTLDDTIFVVLGDHGHLQVDYKVCPNVLLARAGLLDVDGNGTIVGWRAYVQSCGISAQLFSRDAEARVAAEVALAPLLEHRLVSDVFPREQAERDYHTAGDFDLMMEASPNHAFGDEATGELVTAADSSDYKYAVSTHGHLPFRGDRPCLMVMGPGVRPGRHRGMRLVDEAPTLMDLAGIPFDPTSMDGASLAEVCR